MSCSGKPLSNDAAKAYRAGLHFRPMSDADEHAAHRFRCGQEEVDQFLADRALEAAADNWCVTCVSPTLVYR